MALVASQLSLAMQDAVEGQPNASAALIALGNSIANYIKANAEITFNWVAVNSVPPFEADPVVTATGKFITVVISLTPSMATTHPAAKLHLETEISTSMRTSTYNITQIIVPPFSTAPGIASDIVNILLNITGKTDRESAFLQMATDIVTWIKSYIPVSPCSGSRGTYVGAGTVTGII